MSADQDALVLEKYRLIANERLRRAKELASYKLAVEREGGHLHVLVTGQNSKDSVVAYLAEVLSLCDLQRCYRVLIEERLDGPRLPVENILEVVRGARANLEGRSLTLAVVDVNASGAGMEYAEAAAVMSGMNMRLFQSVEEAKRWLGDR